MKAKQKHNGGYYTGTWNAKSEDTRLVSFVANGIITPIASGSSVSWGAATRNPSGSYTLACMILEHATGCACGHDTFAERVLTAFRWTWTYSIANVIHWRQHRKDATSGPCCIDVISVRRFFDMFDDRQPMPRAARMNKRNLLWLTMEVATVLEDHKTILTRQALSDAVGSAIIVDDALPNEMVVVGSLRAVRRYNSWAQQGA